MDESINDEPLVIDGLFADMFTADFEITTSKVLYPNDKAMLCDLSKVKDDIAIIGTSVRVNSMEKKDGKLVLNISGASSFRANIRIKVDFIPENAEIDGKSTEIFYDALSHTALISFDSVTGERTLIIE